MRVTRTFVDAELVKILSHFCRFPKGILVSCPIDLRSIHNKRICTLYTRVALGNYFCGSAHLVSRSEAILYSQFTADRTSRHRFPVEVMAIFLIIIMSRMTPRSTQRSVGWIPRMVFQK
jgi:hypothetical protein